MGVARSAVSTTPHMRALFIDGAPGKETLTSKIERGNEMNTTNALFRFVKPQSERRSVKRGHSIAAALVSVSAILVAAAAVSDEEIRPMEDTSFSLGSFRGSAYYTFEQDGHHLRVSLASASSDKEPAEPLRFETVLPVGGSATLSTSGAGTQKPVKMTFHRVGDRLGWGTGAELAATISPKVSRTQPLTALAEPQQASLTTSELYASFRDAALHQPDDLGSYSEDYRAAYPN